MEQSKSVSSQFAIEASKKTSTGNKADNLAVKVLEKQVNLKINKEFTITANQLVLFTLILALFEACRITYNFSIRL